MKQRSIPKVFRWTSVFIFALVILVSTNFGCYLQPQEETSGCGTQMGCCPATGCGNYWHGNNTNLCYATANACNNAGNNYCRQCY